MYGARILAVVSASFHVLPRSAWPSRRYVIWIITYLIILPAGAKPRKTPTPSAGHVRRGAGVRCDWYLHGARHGIARQIHAV